MTKTSEVIYSPTATQVAKDTLVYLAKHACDESVRLEAAVRLLELTK